MRQVSAAPAPRTGKKPKDRQCDIVAARSRGNLPASPTRMVVLDVDCMRAFDSLSAAQSETPNQRLVASRIRSFEVIQ